LYIVYKKLLSPLCGFWDCGYCMVSTIISPLTRLLGLWVLWVRNLVFS